jgi:hypothetical protein
MFLFAVAGVIMAVSNIIGLSAQDSINRDTYFIYAVEKHINEGVLIACLGVIFTTIGFKINSGDNNRSYRLSLPKIRYVIDERRGVSFFVTFSVIVLVLRLNDVILPFIGAFEALLFMAVPAGIFYLSRWATLTKNKKYFYLAIVLVIAETVRALLFDFLRLHFVIPSFAFLLGFIFGKGRIGGLFSLRLFPVYLVLAVFVSFFSFFGNNRSSLSRGTERFTDIQSLIETNDGVDEENTLFMRFSNFNQLSNVVQVVEEDGYYEGSTLSYLGFAFIPRIIWPEKPLIQMGAWFAQRIGRGYINEYGRFTNAINMTASGELYMNFGYAGVIFGSLFFGMLISIFWSSVSMVDEPNNIPGTLFGFYLLFLGLFSFGANLSILVTILAMYLASLLFAFALKIVKK